MTSRLRYPELAPDGYAALSAFGHYVNTGTALEPVLLGLVYLRASVLNGCAFCTELHKAELRKHREPESRIEAVVDTPVSEAFTPRERAALRWTEVMTRLTGDHAPDADYAEISRFFEGKDLVDLTFAVANINAWNRMGVAFQPEWRPRAGRHAGASGASGAPEGTEKTQSAAAEGAPASAPAATKAPAPPIAEGGSSAASDDDGKVGLN